VGGGHSLRAYLQSVKNVFLLLQHFPSLAATQRLFLYTGGNPVYGFHAFAADPLLSLIGIIMIMSDEGTLLSHVNRTLSASNYAYSQRPVSQTSLAAGFCLLLATVLI
jgi:hypothetical protein